MRDSGTARLAGEVRHRRGGTRAVRAVRQRGAASPVPGHARVAAHLDADAPTVVLVHGLAVSHRYPTPLATLLAPSFDVRAVDLPGFGLSDDPGAALGLRTTTDRLVERDMRDAGLRRVLATSGHALNDAIERKLSDIDVPALVTRGAIEPIVPARWAAEVTRLLPRGEFADVAAGPHNCVYAAAEPLAAVTVPFLDRTLRG